jgi:spermidine synthase
VRLDVAAVPGGGELRLLRRGAELSNLLGTNPLMNSRMSGSEQALANLTCARLAGRRRPHLLIGGLGMGFTLRSALAALPADAIVVVAELVPAVIAWAHGPMAELFGTSLADPRLTLREADVGQLIATPATLYDAILLDVDNGPDGLTQSGNDRLYSAAGLKAAKLALRPGGVLAVWSVAPDAAFTQRLARAGFAVEETRVRAHGKSGPRHTIWLATRR